MLYYAAIALYFLIPSAALIFFAWSLVSFIIAKRKNRQVPGAYTDEQIRTRKICLIVSSVIAGIMAAVIIGFMCLLFMAVAFM